MVVNGLSGTNTRNYQYDELGNLLTDDSKYLTHTEYGRSAYPYKLTIDGDIVDYLYAENDQRIYKKVVSPTEIKKDYYLVDAMGKTIAILNSTEITATEIVTEAWSYFITGAEREVRLTPSSGQEPGNNTNNVYKRFEKMQATYYLYDHLGNTRVTYMPVGYNATNNYMLNEILYIADYFPYGKVLREYVNGDKERYLTTQHERDNETGLDYRGARYYDSDVARFLSLDPLASDYPSLSDYSYVAGNPIIFIDPDGRSPQTKYINESGVLLYETYDGSDDIITVKEDELIDFITLVILTPDDMLDSKEWNEAIKSNLLGFDDKEVLLSTMLNSQTSQSSRQALINYYQDPSMSNWVSYLVLDVVSQNLNPLNHLPSPIGVKTKIPKAKLKLKPKTGNSKGPNIKVGAVGRIAPQKRSSNPWILFNKEVGPGNFVKSKFSGSSKKARAARVRAYAVWKSENGYR